MVDGQQGVSLPIQGDAYDHIFFRAAQEVRLQNQREVKDRLYSGLQHAHLRFCAASGMAATA